MLTLAPKIATVRPEVSRSTPFDRLLARLATKTATVGIMGLGYVGLPLADAFIQAGLPVLGFDVDQAKVKKLERGESYIQHIPDEKVRAWRAGRRFAATADVAELARADAILICVPTPLTETREPDLRYVESTARAIAQILRPGQLVVLESTTYPGTDMAFMVKIDMVRQIGYFYPTNRLLLGPII